MNNILKLLPFLLLSLVLNFNLATTSVLQTNTALALTNSTILAPGQTTTFLNGTIKFVNITTYYQTPNVGNIHQLGNKLWGVTTYINIKSTYINNVPLSQIYFKSLVNNPSNISIYELNTTSKIVNVSNTFVTGTKFISTPNGTVNENIFNTINTTTQVNISTWLPLSLSNTMIRPGINQFKIIGTGIPTTSYTWEYSISTSNLITTGLTIGPGLKLKNAPITSIIFDPTWIIPSGVTNVINVSIKDNDGTNAIGLNSVINIPVNELAYASVINGGSNNIVVFNGITGQILPSWLAGNASNEITRTVNTANTVNLYIKLTPASIAAGTNAVNVISIGTESMSTTAFAANTGEAPQFTGALGSSTWGTYDDGANVFFIYSNFTGSSLSSVFNSAASYNTGTIEKIVNNGLFVKSLGSGGSSFGIITAKSVSPSSNGVIDTLFGNYIHSGGTPNIGPFLTTTHTSGGTTGPGFQNSYGITESCTNVVGSSCTELAQMTTSETPMATAPASVSPNETLTNWSYVGGEFGVIGTNNLKGTLSNVGGGLKTYGEIGEAGGGQSAGATFYWYAGWNKTYIQSPTIVFGGIQGISSGTTCSFTTSNAAINFGTIQEGQNTIGTDSGYTYNIITITNTGASTSNIFLSGSNWNSATANTFKVTNTIWSLEDETSAIAVNVIDGPLSSIVAPATSNVEYQLTGSQVDTLRPILASGTNTIAFGLNVPINQAADTYAQTINIISSC